MEAFLMVKKKRGVQEVSDVAEPVALEETTVDNSLRASLEEIKKYDGVIGYIQRNTTSASIDFKDPTKIMDYALLSSLAFDAGRDFSELFDIGDVKSTLVGGKNVKMLSVIIGENKISVFMEKNADAEKVLTRLQAS
jgi:predicted regulator of Ras-like GTPase activity (Roadblock/LC7/MglB family)